MISGWASPFNVNPTIIMPSEGSGIFFKGHQIFIYNNPHVPQTIRLGYVIYFMKIQSQNIYFKNTPTPPPLAKLLADLLD